MLTIFLAVAFLALLVFSVDGRRRNQGGDGWLSMIVVSIIFMVIMAIVVPATYAANAQRIAQLKAFQEINVQNYGITVTETKTILSSEGFVGKLVAGSLEKTELGKSISERVKEWRDEVNGYNLEVADKKKARTLSFYPGWMYIPAEINELPLLIIENKIR